MGKADFNVPTCFIFNLFGSVRCPQTYASNRVSNDVKDTIDGDRNVYIFNHYTSKIWVPPALSCQGTGFLS